jgi:hypothetical protein
MNKLILCEGATDAVLLSYYLERRAGWQYSRKSPKNLDIRVDSATETVNWYKKDDDYLLISAVGGKDNFGNFFKRYISAPLFDAAAFGKIAVLTDRDQRAASDIEKAVKAAFAGINADIRNDVWVSGAYQDAYNINREISILLTVIPKEHQGALETVMLEAISEDPYDKNIVDCTRDFAGKMRNEAEKYISSDRLQLKAHLGLTWAVQYPEKVFSLIDEQIRSVRWEESEILAECFARLIEI